MKLTTELVTKNDKLERIIQFPTSITDTSWMNSAQLRLFEVLKNEENRNKKYTEICALAGYKPSSFRVWYDAIKDERFDNILTMMGVKTRMINDKYLSHNEVSYIKDNNERIEYLKNDVWDMRLLCEDYPRHRDPSIFRVDFTKIENIQIRKVIKKYYVNMLLTWKALNFRTVIILLSHFFSSMYELYPDINSLDLLERDNVELIIQNMKCSKTQKQKSLSYTKYMFDYMYFNKFTKAPSPTLLNKYDIPKVEDTEPRPIPPGIKIQLDDYIESHIITLLENGIPTPIVEPKYWDLIIIIRYTGRRFEDICHLIESHNEKNKDCLQYDLDGDPMLYLDHRIAKIPKDLRIPLAHLKDSNGKNIVENAILRQTERVKNLSPAPDGYKYLFRDYKIDSSGNSVIDCITYNHFSKTILPKLSSQIPLTNYDGSYYKISSHQFRHTVATEMIDAGIDIYAVKEFLGHSSVRMTEKYIKVYQQRLKKEFKDKLNKSDATEIINKLQVDEEELYDNKWVKNKIIGVFELGDGCCEHPYKMPSCPHMTCKTCIKKKIYPRHLQAVKNTIESETIHRDNAISMGLQEKSEEFNKVVQFYTIALGVIEQNKVFEASKHFYTKGV